MQVCGLELKLVQRLDEVFTNFKKQKIYTHAFIIGVTNHWITLIGNKSEKGIELVLLDSRNTDFINLSTEEMQKLITQHYDERERLTGKKIEHRPWREKTYMVSMQDTIHVHTSLTNI